MKQIVVGCLVLACSMAVEAGMDKDESWPFNHYVRNSLSKVVAVVPNMPSVKDPSKMVTQIWLQSRGTSSNENGGLGGGGLVVCESIAVLVDEETRCYNFK